MCPAALPLCFLCYTHTTVYLPYNNNTTRGQPTTSSPPTTSPPTTSSPYNFSFIFSFYIDFYTRLLLCPLHLHHHPLHHLLHHHHMRNTHIDFYFVLCHQCVTDKKKAAREGRLDLLADPDNEYLARETTLRRVNSPLSSNRTSSPSSMPSICVRQKKGCRFLHPPRCQQKRSMGPGSIKHG